MLQVVCVCLCGRRKAGRRDGGWEGGRAGGRRATNKTQNAADEAAAAAQYQCWRWNRVLAFVLPTQRQTQLKMYWAWQLALGKETYQVLIFLRVVVDSSILLAFYRGCPFSTRSTHKDNVSIYNIDINWASHSQRLTLDRCNSRGLGPEKVITLHHHYPSPQSHWFSGETIGVLLTFLASFSVVFQRLPLLTSPQLGKKIPSSC
jgi:hypothetical protein